MSRTRPWVIIGNPENRRVKFFQEALASRGQSPALVLSYIDLLTGRRSVDEIPRRCLVRIDSPGENFLVEKLLLAAGRDAAAEEGSPVIDGRQIDQLPEDPGRILFPRQWFLGYCHSLLHWQRCLAQRNDIRFLSQPRDIALMFDKQNCHRQCQIAGLPVPQSLSSVRNFDDLMNQMESRKLERVFVKLAHGSSASGVVAFYRRGDRLEAITSAELVQENGTTLLYNSLKIRRYTTIDNIRAVVDALAPHRVHVEEWLPKASLAGRVCDLRVVVISRDPQHMVVRTSRTPLTNLHLGNRRGNLEELLRRVSIAQQEALAKTCRTAAMLCPETIQVAVDILFTPGFRRHSLLEINAFGDLLPRVECAGKNTYEAQIDAVTVQRDAVNDLAIKKPTT
jgi:hypothetical protein